MVLSLLWWTVFLVLLLLLLLLLLLYLLTQTHMPQLLVQQQQLNKNPAPLLRLLNHLGQRCRFRRLLLLTLPPARDSHFALEAERESAVPAAAARGWRM